MEIHKISSSMVLIAALLASTGCKAYILQQVNIAPTVTVVSSSEGTGVEYIVVHELVHLLERHHNDNFLAMMNEYLPQWRSRRSELNAAPLAHATWSY